MDEHRRLILDQFTRQAVPFSEMHARDDNAIYQLLIEASGIADDDRVLDVACGPGLVACEVAKVAKHVTGIDLTPAMLDQAQARQRLLGLNNLTWQVGEAQRLPFPDGHFSQVITRYSFHHFADPAAVFAEMARVCAPGGRVTVCDVFTTSEEQADLYDQLEKYRDPSHTHALQLSEIESLFASLENVRREYYKYPVTVESLMSRSFPDLGGAEAFRRMVDADVGVDRLGLGATRDGGLGFSFQVVIVSGQIV